MTNKNPMTSDILSRLTTLSASAPTPHSTAAAQILRRLASDDNACDKVVGMAASIKKLDEAGQILVLDAVEKVVKA